MTHSMTIVPDTFVRDHLGRDWGLLKPERIASILLSEDGHAMKIYLKPQGVINFRIYKGSGNELEKYFLIDPDIRP